MSNPFKRGDKIVRLPQYAGSAGWVASDYGLDPVGTVYEVWAVSIVGVFLSDDGQSWAYDRFRAAIAGQDYPVPAREFQFHRNYPPSINGPLEYAPNTGHLPDGSSVQKHSAGPLYPCVIAMRDGILGGKYDYGVISPRNQEPLWLSTHEAAVSVAETIKKDLT